MITIFNRKEVCTTFDMKEQARVREVLACNNINYKYRVVNMTYSRARSGSFGENAEFSRQYYIYVHKKDYNQALYLINKDR